MVLCLILCVILSLWVEVSLKRKHYSALQTREWKQSEVDRYCNLLYFICELEEKLTEKIEDYILPSLPPSDQTAATEEAHLFTAFNWYRWALRTQCVVLVLSAKCVQSAIASSMPPSGTPQVIHSQTSSLAQVLVEFHFCTLKKQKQKTKTQHWDVTLAMPHHQIALREANSSNQSRVVMSAFRGFSVNGCVSLKKWTYIYIWLYLQCLSTTDSPSTFVFPLQIHLHSIQKFFYFELVMISKFLGLTFFVLLCMYVASSPDPLKCSVNWQVLM